jgi:hypothetical protein
MDRKAWLILAAASLALATAATVLVLVRRSPWGEHFTEVPDLISDCYDRIRDIETDLQQLRPNAQPAAG